MSKRDTIRAKQRKLQEAFLEQLKRTPTIEQACQKSGIPRTSIYRWRREEKKFDKAVEESLAEGRLFMCDIAETQLFSLIGEKEYKAIALYLSTHNPRYAKKLELSGSVTTKDAPLTKEQKKDIREALKLSTIGKHGKEKGKTE